jgi:hypothetical protein
LPPWKQQSDELGATFTVVDVADRVGP